MGDAERDELYQKIRQLEVRLDKSVKSKELIRSTMEERLASHAERLLSSEEENECLRREMVVVLSEAQVAHRMPTELLSVPTSPLLETTSLRSPFESAAVSPSRRW